MCDRPLAGIAGWNPCNNIIIIIIIVCVLLGISPKEHIQYSKPDESLKSRLLLLLGIGYRPSFPGLKRPGREVDRSPPSGVEVKNEWSYSFTPPYVLMERSGAYTPLLPY